jgi:hypothetical protein
MSVFMAHTGAALVTKKTDERLPVAACLTAAWVFDLTGVGHWAPVAALFAAVGFWYGARRWDARAGLVLAGTVIAHDLLDLVVGVQLLPGGRYLGLSWAGRDPREVTLECVIVLAGWALWQSTLKDRRRPVVMGPLAAMAVIIAAHAATDQRSQSHHVGTAQGVVLVLGLILSWAAVIGADRSRGSLPTAG